MKKLLMVAVAVTALSVAFGNSTVLASDGGDPQLPPGCPPICLVK